MSREISLSSKLGEVMSPKTLVTALIVGPDGSIHVDPGALHGRSELESQLQFVRDRSQVSDGQPWWIVWVAIELDDAQQPQRYKGAAVSEILVDRSRRMGYKSLPEHVNRMSEAMRGVVNIARLSSEHRQRVRQQLLQLNEGWWQNAPAPFQAAFGVS